LDVAELVGLERHLTPKAIEMRKQLKEVMEANEKKFIECDEKAEFPHFLLPKLAQIGIGGPVIPKEYGGLGLSQLDFFSLYAEAGQHDLSVCTFGGVHCGLGINPILYCGSEEMKKRIIPAACNLDKILCFALTEPTGGSDVSSAMRTVAKKTEGGWIINGAKRWIGNATFADYIIVWARNVDDNNRIQGFVVENPSKGLTVSKIEGKMSIRMVQNADLKLDNVFVPDHNKIEKALDFEKSLREVLVFSRLGVAWAMMGASCGVYQKCLKYCL
jgi:glutaryl-CoA dehydrogenase